MYSIEIDPVKVNAVLDWEPPRNVKDNQSLLGFGNFYLQFILKYSILWQLLFQILQKDGTPFV